MSFTCEISGEPLATTQEEVVVTPSGHVCIKRLLLAKLTENGGMDPFEQIRERPLSEDQLITLSSKSSATKMAPPRPSATSLPNLLQTIQNEYDALVLELFDTRKALEDTRKELSQALYQNDAAVRVVARLSMERDSARQELERWNASVGSAPAATETGNGTARAAPAAEEEPQAKRRKVAPPSEPLNNDLPEEDSSILVSTWETLQPQRKPTLSAAKAAAPSADDLGKYASTDQKSWHKSTCKSVQCMAADSSTGLLATAGKDKQLMVYSTSEKVVKQTFSLGSANTTSVDILGDYAVAGDESGKIQLFNVTEGGAAIGTYQADAAIVNIRIHPSQKHLCATVGSGKVMVLCIMEDKIVPVSIFQQEGVDTTYACGALHPDGLLYAAGTSNGEVHMWDFKNKALASTLKEGDSSEAVTSIAFSNNGYHLATADASATVRFWDLRKQKTMTSMNASKDLLASVTSLAYDASGQYVAMGGEGGVKVTTVKKWGTTASIEGQSAVSGIVWTKDNAIATCSSKERAVHFNGLA